MIKYYIKFRTCLTNNKIIFDVVVSLSLTFMGVFVSIKANNIAENQTKIMELENSPRIEIRKNQIYNESLKIYDITHWFIFNHNSKVANFDITENISFINIKKKSNFSEINVPLLNYLNLGGTISGQSENLIFEFDNKYTGYNEYLARNLLWSYGYLEINSYIKVRYDNVLKKNEEKYYQVSPLIKEINRNIWDSLEIIWNKNIFRGVYLDNNTENNVKRFLN